MFSSGMTGYTPNPSEAAVSDNWMGPYQMMKKMNAQVETWKADYVWLPIGFEGENPRIRWQDSWKMDL